MLTNKLILDYILKIERKLNQNEFIVDGLNYWPAIRIKFAFNLIQKRYQNLNKKNFLTQLKEFFFLLLKSFNKVKKSNVLLVSHKNYGVKVDSVVYDRVLSGYINKFSKNKISYCYLDLDDYKVTHYLPKLKVKTEYINIYLLKIIAYLSNFFSKSFRSIASNFEDLCMSINDKNLNDKNIEKKKLVIYLSYIRILKFFFKIFLKRRGIKEVYQSIYYDPIGLAINSAANELGLKTYCVQHGGQSINNPAFGKWSIISHKGYFMLPKKFLCWDEQSAESIRKWSNKTNFHFAEVAEYSWLKMWTNNLIHFEEIKNIEHILNNNFNIIYTMQPSFDKFPKLILDLISKYNSQIMFWIRFHPRHHYTKFYFKTKKILERYQNVNFYEASSYPLPALMSKMDLHLTGFSSSIYEANHFNIKTVFFDKQGKDYFYQFIEDGKAYYLPDINQIEKFLSSRINIH